MRLAVCVAALTAVSWGCAQILGLNDYAERQNPAAGGSAGSTSSTTSTTGGGGVGGTGGSLPPGKCAGVSMLGDDLDGSNDGPWTEITETGAFFMEGNGQVTATSQFDSTGNAWRVSESYHDLRGEAVWIEVRDVTSDASADTFFQVGDRDVNSRVNIRVTGTEIAFEQFVAGAYSKLGTATYDPVNDRFWLIREEGGDVSLETAAAAEGPWMIRAKVAVAQLFPFDYVEPRYGIDKTLTTTANETATFANVNGGLTSAEPWCKADTLTDTFTAGMGPTRVWRHSELYRDCIITESTGNVVFGVSSPTQCNYGSSSRYDLTGSSFQIHVTSLSVPVDAVVYMQIESERNTAAVIQLQNNVLAARTIVKGMQSGYFNLDNAAQPTWWRFKDVGGGQVEVATSIDGTIWIPEQTINPAIPLDSVRLRFGIYGGTGASSVSFGSLNAGP